MGDYPLKRASTYRVPDHMRINIEKKRRQKILLEESIYNMKAEFNGKVLGLRDIKEKLIESIIRANARIGEINKILNVDEPLFHTSFQVSK